MLSSVFKGNLIRLKNKIVISMFLLTIPFAFHQCKQSSFQKAKPHNIILIISDALRRDVLGCYGGDCYTPNIDWLAQNGTLFENAYSTAPCTVPSSVAMFTGNYSTTYRKNIVRRKKSHSID